MSGLADSKYDEKSGIDEAMREKSIGGHHAEILENKELMTDAQNAELREHEMGLWEAAKDHPAACFWAFIFCFTIVSPGLPILECCEFMREFAFRLITNMEQVMESFDMFLNGNFVALTAFKERYGVEVPGQATKAIPTKWQSSLFQAGQCGAFVGVFVVGPITDRLGYRWTNLLALVLMNATIFVSFFVSGIFPRSMARLLADSIDPGRLTLLACRRASIRRSSMGNVHWKLACLC